MSGENEHRLRFREAMASLSAAVNVITTEGGAGRCGITATAVCSVTDTPPTLLMCINSNSAMSNIFTQNGQLCVNVLNHDQEIIARHFAGMTNMSMAERFSLDCWQQGELGQPLLKGALANLEGEIDQVQTIGTHLIYMVHIKNIVLNKEGHGLVYFRRQFHPVKTPAAN